MEDEADAARLLAQGLREQSYAVDLAADGSEAIERTAGTAYDLIILDLMLPDVPGLDVCRQIRVAGDAVPILMVTARDAVADRIQGLDAGADDYLPKPYHLPELYARVRALLRRGPALEPMQVEVGGLIIDSRSRAVSRDGRRIDLTAREYALLEYLARRTGEVVTRAEIADHVWDEGFDAASNVIDVYVQRLRRKVDDGHPCKLIQTRRGTGYTLRAGEADV